MLKSLSLKNLILVEACIIHFEKGFTIISGETGSGKTVFTQAIALALGERADASAIRQGEERALIELVFDVEATHPLFQLLEEAGIEYSTDDLLLIRREIVRSGKNRAFINAQMVTLPLLQKIGASLLDLVGQHSHASLRESDYHRKTIDLFGGLSPLAKEYEAAYTQEKVLKCELEQLLLQNEYREKELNRLQIQLQELKNLNLQPGEEEELSIEHSRLAHFQTLSEKSQRIYQTLSDTPQALIPQLQRLRTVCESLSLIDANIKEPEELLKQAIVALQESSNFFNSYTSRLENDPYRFQFLEDRLAEIHKMKQKYGKNFEEITNFQQQLQEKILQFSHLEQKIEDLNQKIEEAFATTTLQCQKLSQGRRATSLELQNALTKSLRSLNMTECELRIEISTQPRSQTGEDQLQFWLKANKGESASLVKNSSSGGELSRLMLAIKCVLAEKNNTPTLIFDEIDSNVGGETAALIGEELKALGKYRQILCITHFPQVASFADHHIRVQKIEKEGRTVAKLEELDKKAKEKEILRMLGGKKY